LRILSTLGAIVLSAASAGAQTYEGNEATIGTQWRGTDGNLSGYIAAGYRVAAVTQQFTASDRGIVNITSYFLQKETSLVRCNEMILPPPPPPKGKAGGKPVAPTVILGCAEAITPGPAPFSSKPAIGFEGMLPGR